VIEKAEAAMRFGLAPIDIEEMRMTLTRLRGGECLLLEKIATEAPDRLNFPPVIRSHLQPLNKGGLGTSLQLFQELGGSRWFGSGLN
jgi:hypothetical protein